MAYTPNFALTVNGTAPDQTTTDALLKSAVDAALQALFGAVKSAAPVTGAVSTFNAATVSNTTAGTTYTATSPSEYLNLGQAAGDAFVIIFVPPTANLGPATLALDGGDARAITTATGSALVGGELTNRPVILRKWSSTWRVLNDNPLDKLRSVMPQAGVLQTYSAATVSNTTAGTTYTATSPSEYLAYGLSANDARTIIFVPPNSNLGVPTLSIDGGTALEIKSATGSTLSAGVVAEVSG